MAPAPLSGIHEVALGLFALASAATGITWTLSTGLISYLLGEAAKDLVGRIGVQGVLFATILTTVGLLYRFLWRRFVRSETTGSIPEKR